MHSHAGAWEREKQHRHSGLSGIGFIGGFDCILRYSACLVIRRTADLKPNVEQNRAAIIFSCLVVRFRRMKVLSQINIVYFRLLGKL